MKWFSWFFKPKISSYQIEGTYENYYSLSIVNQNIAKALHHHTDAKVRLDPTPWHQAYMETIDDLDEEIIALASTSLDEVEVSIRNIYPPHTQDMRGAIKIIGPYGWEESKFPQAYIQAFNRDLDMVLTMSNYTQEVLLANGLTIPTVVTGLVVEDLLYTKMEPLPFALPKGFRLLHISSLFPRKGGEELLEAFEGLAVEEVVLIIKSFPNPHNHILDQLKERDFVIQTNYEKGIDLYLKGEKKILLINKNLSREAIKYLYMQCNLLVAPSFGEGFGLPMAEAMLMELPVVTTAYGGQMDFCHPEHTWLVAYQLQEAETHLNLEDSMWAVPSVASLQEQIESVYHAKASEILAKVKRAKSYILQHYSAKEVAQRIERAVWAIKKGRS